MPDRWMSRPGVPPFTFVEAATIRITSKDWEPEEPEDAAIPEIRTGTLAIVIPDTRDFGNVCAGSFVDRNFTLNNNGPCELRILDIQSSSPEFEPPLVFSWPLVIAPGDSIALPIRFKPTSFGDKSAMITITSDDPASPKAVPVCGHVPAPRLATMMAADGEFGSVQPGSFADQRVQLCNAGHCTLTITGIESSSAAFLAPAVQGYPFTVAPGFAIDVPIRFRPSEMGRVTGTITVFSNDPAGSQSVEVSGESCGES